jgi:hypothetical protein
MKNFKIHTVCQITLRKIEEMNIGWARHVARPEKIKCAYKVVAGKGEGTITLVTLERRWQDDNKMDT